MRLLSPPSIKLYGGAMIPTLANLVDGVYNTRSLHRDWAANWDSWIKPQIDALAGNGVGGNFLRAIGTHAVVADGILSQAEYNANWTQLFNYCKSKGVYVLTTLGHFFEIEASGLSNSTVIDGLTATLAHLEQFKGTLIGVDLCSESNGWGFYYPGTGQTAANAKCIAYYNGVKAGTAIPLSFSTYELMTSTACRDWVTAMSSAMDFFDFHVYSHGGYNATNPVPESDLLYWFTNYPTLDIIFGESGSYPSNTYDQQETFLRAVFKNASIGDPRMRGVAKWAIIDQSITDPLDKWGIYTDLALESEHAPAKNVIRSFTGGYTAKRN